MTHQEVEYEAEDAARAALLDEAFAYPEFSSFFSPSRQRARLDDLLKTHSEYLCRRDGVLIWLGQGATAVFINYLARSAELLDRYAADALAQFEPVMERDGVNLVQIYAVSPEARDTWNRLGFESVSEFLRMRHDEAGPQPPDPRIRARRPEDITPLARVGMRAFPHETWPIENWEETLRLTPCLWVAEVEGKPAGFIMGSVIDEAFMITGLAIDPEIHGGGLGTALVNRMLATAHEQGRSRVEVLADGKSRVVHFYERSGFKPLYPGYYVGRKWER